MPAHAVLKNVPVTPPIPMARTSCLCVGIFFYDVQLRNRRERRFKTKQKIGKTSLFYFLTHTFIFYLSATQVQNPNKRNRLVYASTILFPTEQWVCRYKKKKIKPFL